MQEKNNTNLERMRELIEQLTEADIAYYKNDAPIMTDLEYDRLTEELASLEHDTGLVLSGSPTQKVSGEFWKAWRRCGIQSPCCPQARRSPLRI